MSALRKGSVLITLFVSVFALFWLPGCSISKKEPACTQIVRLNFAGDIDTLDPRKTAEETSANLLNMAYEGLFRTGLDGKLGPGLAERHEVSADGLTYTFYLRDAQWSDGTPITAYDFEYSWKQALSPAFISPAKSKFFLLAGAEEAALGKGSLDDVGVCASDEKTLQVRLKNPAPYFPNLIAMWNYYPVRAGIDEASPHWQTDLSAQAFSGPFVIRNYQHSSRLTLRKNPLYWDADHVHIDGIEITMIRDAHTELEMFEHGELDWAGQPLSFGLPIDALEPLKQNGELQETGSSKVYFCLFNAQKAPFNNKLVRQAFSYAINRSEVVNYMAQGGQQPALGFIPPMYSKAKRAFFQDGDREKAVSLFEKALEQMGCTRATFPKVVINAYSSPAQEKIVQIAKQWESAFGISVCIEKSEWSEHIRRLQEKDYQALCVNWFPDIPDSAPFLAAFDSDGDDLTGWENSEYTKLLKQASCESSAQKRSELLARAEHLLAEDMPAAPLYFNGPSYLINERLVDVGVGNLGIVEFKWARFIPDDNAL